MSRANVKFNERMKLCKPRPSVIQGRLQAEAVSCALFEGHCFAPPKEKESSTELEIWFISHI